MPLTKEQKLERLKERQDHIRSNTLPLIDLKGHYRTSSLFNESFRFTSTDPSIYVPLWTLSERPKSLPPSSIFYGKAGGGTNILPSFRQLYLDACDPTEYNFALRTLGSWTHWLDLLRFQPIAKQIEDWRALVRLKIEAEALDAARKIAKEAGGPTSLQAAKWLHSKVAKSTGPGRGRPSKDEVKAEVKKMAQDERDLQADLVRIGKGSESTDLERIKPYAPSTNHVPSTHIATTSPVSVGGARHQQEVSSNEEEASAAEEF